MQQDSAGDEGGDRRRENRQIACFPADMRLPSGKQELSLIRDLSVTGALLFTSRPIEKGEEVSLELHLEEDPENTIPVEASVVRCSTRSTPETLWRYSVAVRFLEPLHDFKAEVDALLAKLPPLPVGEV